MISSIQMKESEQTARQQGNLLSKAPNGAKPAERTVADQGTVQHQPADVALIAHEKMKSLQAEGKAPGITAEPFSEFFQLAVAVLQEAYEESGLGWPPPSPELQPDEV